MTEEKPTTLSQEDTAWSEDALFQPGNIQKYNPDNLIGKKGSSIYKKMMLDEQIKAVVKFKRDAITSRRYVFEIDEDHKEVLGEKECERRIKVSNEIVRQMSGTLIDALNGIMSSMWQGVSYTEKVFKNIEVDGKTYWGIDKLKLKPFDTFSFKVDEYGNEEALIQEIAGKKKELDRSNFVHHVQGPEYDAQYGQSELREAYRSWFSKDMAIIFYNMYMEKVAGGFKWINTKSAKGSKEYKAIQEVLSNTVNGAGMILGINDEFHIEFPAGNGEVFTKAIDKHDLGIARALLVPNLMGITPSGQTGSYSQSDTQLEAFLWTLDQEASRLEETANEQIFRGLGEANFGDDMWPRFSMMPISEKRKISIITLWKDLVSVGGVKHSETDEAHIREQLDFPAKEEGVEDDESGENNLPTNEGAKTGEKEGDEEAGKQFKAAKAREGEPERLTIAAKRVDFRVIQRATEMEEETKSSEIGRVIFEMVGDVVNQTRDLYSRDELEEKLATIKFNKNDKAKLQRRINSALQDFWHIGMKHAENEIDKAKGLAFSLRADRDRLKFISSDFFKIKSFKVAGKMSDDVIAVISQVISNGVKGGKTFAQIEEDIYRNVGGAGYLTMEDYRKALGEAIDPNLKNPQARIDTMLRTNGFEAVNEARFSYFTDPQLNGFVEALEYSSVLDGRTTQICQHLDGHVHAANSAEWQSYRPPNHYNCRSLLIPVTQVDSWTESDAPEIEPQKGFA